MDPFKFVTGLAWMCGPLCTVTLDAWHFLPADCQFRGKPIEPGQRYAMPPDDARHWEPNYYACSEVDEAVFYALGPVVVRARLWSPQRRKNNTWRAESWEALWMADATRTLRAYCIAAAREAEGAMPERARRSINVAQNYMDGSASEDDLADAYNEAMAVTYSDLDGAAWYAACACDPLPHQGAMRTLAISGQYWPRYVHRRDALRECIEALAPLEQKGLWTAVKEMRILPMLEKKGA